MSFKLSELLNPAPTSAPPSPRHQSPPPLAVPPLADPSAQSPALPSEPQLESHYSHPTATTHDAASALTTLAHGGPSNVAIPGYGWNAQYGGATAAGYEDARRRSSHGSFASPMEPSAPVERSQFPTPWLEQYHHGSKSPEEQRRQSVMSYTSDSIRLAPINRSSLPSILGDRPQPESPADSPHFAYGQDTSKTTSPSVTEAVEAGWKLDPNTIAHAREPDYDRHEPTTSQIRAPSPPAQDVHESQSRPEALSAPPQRSSAPNLTSPPPQIKPEPTVVSREPTPAQAIGQPEQVQPEPLEQDQETLKAVASLKNEHGLRGANRETNPTTTAPLPAPVMDAPNSSPPSKKRKPVNSIIKKGAGGKKPPDKKRKVDDTENGSLNRPSPTPSSRTSRTPGAKSKKGTPVAGSSPAPQSSPPPEDDVESGSDDGIYCICRKGDNHTWMIACDGPCQDWYHGTCVKVREEDEELIEKYYCPQCTEAGEGRTTWKRMCRRQGCRRPAQRDKQSKYCSDECGVQFFKDLSSDLRGGSQNAAPKSRTRRRANQTDNTGNEDDEDEDWAGPRGGVLSVRDLKAMADGAQDVDHFKGLGSSMLSPPNTASPTQTSFKPEPDGTNGDDGLGSLTNPDAATGPTTYTLDATETGRVETITAETARLQERVVHFKDKERFVAMSREAAGRYAEREGIKIKDICGYDGRLAWSDGEFARWRASKRGKTALRLGTLEPPSPVPNGAPKPEVDGEADDADAVMGEGGDGDGDGGAESVDSLEQDAIMCTKKRCGKHHQWLKVATLDAQFEVSLARQQIAALEAEEKDIRERAVMRWRSEKIEGDRNKEGWVEELE